MCVGHMKHMKHMKFEKGFFERTAGENAFQRMGNELLPPLRRSPSLEEGGLGAACPLEDSYTTPGAGSQPCSFQRGVWGS